MKEQPAFVGAIVHFVWSDDARGTIHRAAIIINTWQAMGCTHHANATPKVKAANRMRVALSVFNTVGHLYLVPEAEYEAEGRHTGTWHWPEEVIEERE